MLRRCELKKPRRTTASSFAFISVIRRLFLKDSLRQMSREMKSNNIAVSLKILFSFWHVQPCNHQSSFKKWVCKKNEPHCDFASISWHPGVQLYNQITFLFWVSKLLSDTLECVSVWLGSRMNINYRRLEKSSVRLSGEFCWSLFNSEEKYNSGNWNERRVTLSETTSKSAGGSFPMSKIYVAVLEAS